MRILYRIASYFLFALLSPVLLLHPKLRHGLKRRLGFYPEGFLNGGSGPRIWLHGASAGDLLALAPILEGLRQRMPEATLIVSTLTNSGHMMASRLGKVDAITYLPYDLPGATRRAVRALRPDLLVLEYTEIWPNLIRAAHRSGARIALTNGRFSADRISQYRWLFSAIGNPLRDIDLFLMREDVEAERVLRLGAPLERVWVTGNTKFDALVGDTAKGSAALAAALGQAGDETSAAPLWIAGSTHEGEEPLILSVLSQLRAAHPRLRMVIAPRYIERAGKILTLARDRGFTAGLRSQGPIDPPPDVVVLDTIGELGQAYRLATIVFVGGSFTDRGGQNILEPAAAGKPVLFGPNMENFHDSVQILVGRGGIQVKDANHLQRVIHDLLERPARIDELGLMARAAVGSVKGAGARDVDHLIKLLGERRSGGHRVPA